MKNTPCRMPALLALGLMLFTGAAQAQLVGDTSKNTISVGPSPNFQRPGISVPATGTTSQFGEIDLPTLASFGSTDAAGVTVHGPGNPIPPPGSFVPLGTFHFAQVSGTNVYFGEWSQSGSATDGTHATFYIGDQTGTTVPTTGSATYAVRGISDYANHGALTGTVQANFGSRVLTGTLSNGDYAVSLGTAAIAGSRIVGLSASASVGGVTVATGGRVSGQFFGANAQAIAGLVAFYKGRQYDTAFGGTRQ